MGGPHVRWTVSDAGADGHWTISAECAGVEGDIWESWNIWAEVKAFDSGAETEPSYIQTEEGADQSCSCEPSFGGYR
uniref:Uncharacterized protein n=1 Tax=Arundo donax TaxID=35708 RepID=A0A0A9DI13_ARUDO